jgi:hypothetical protein
MELNVLGGVARLALSTICLLGQLAVAQSSSQLPDEIAYSIVFQILRTAPPPHWEVQTKCNWLAPNGLTETDVNELVNAANRYFLRAAPLNEKPKQHHEAFKGRLQSAEARQIEASIQREMTTLLFSVVAELRGQLSPKALAGLDSRIAEIKRNTKQANPVVLPGHHQ